MIRKLTIIGTIYRPPGTNLSFFNSELEKVIGLFIKSKVNLILLGDYNINLLNHEIHSETVDFLNLLYANTLLPLISKPTRYGDHSATLIDNVITNMYSQNSMYGIILDDISDHLQIFLAFGTVQNHRSTTHFTKRVRQMNDANFDLFKTKINCVNWQAYNESDA